MTFKSYPCIRTKLPGPNAVQYLEKEKEIYLAFVDEGLPVGSKKCKRYGGYGC